MPPKSTAGSEAPERGAYAGRLNADYWAYVDRVNGFFPPGLATRPIAVQRDAYNAMCRALHPGRPANVATDDGLLAPQASRPLPVRRYRLRDVEPTATVLFFHGGGFVFGDLDSHDDFCADLCGATGLAIVSVDYQLAPEHPHPAAFDDALAAFRHLAASSDLPILLCGESAGGTLAAAVANATRGDPRRAVGQVLIYPELGAQHGRSRTEHANAPLLTSAELASYRTLRAGGRPPSGDPTFDPLRAVSFDGLPPTVIVTAECDPLSSDGEIYRDRILAAGGRALWREEPRLTHSFLRARSTVPRARQAFERIARDILAIARQAYPF